MLKAVLIDDERSSLNSLKEKILNNCPGVTIISICDDPLKGIEAINTLQPDLVFLDIEMPVINGFTLLQQLSYKDFELIFVTAYDHYAIKAIRYSALDYLLKPIEIADLNYAVNNAIAKRKTAKSTAQLELFLENMVSEKKTFKRIAIPTTLGLQFINIDDIVYLEASVNYTKFHLHNNEKYTVSKTLKEFEDMLPDDTFLRIHNSYIINKNYVEKYIRGEGGEVILRNGATLGVSKRKKSEFLKAIGY